MDDYSQGRYGAYKVSLKLAKQLDEPQKPVVPKFVAEWIEYAKKKGDSLAISFKPWNLYGVEYSKADRWIEDNQETFARAWLDGYEVEKEPLYYIKLPGGKNYDMFVDGRDGNLKVFLNGTPGTQYTEQQIKAIDERYWAFAVPVEEAAKG
ncbi:DUF1642 domain-containing protein [Enterococcus mundtii]|uniref:DUF1642 domain-containing protein n=1 Tax=Enterococcus mundtii TaxID=53346 RepID=UPI0039AFF76D